MKGEKKRDKQPVIWSGESKTAFEQYKRGSQRSNLGNEADAPISLVVDATDYEIGAVLKQSTTSGVCPLAFFSKKLTAPQKIFCIRSRIAGCLLCGKKLTSYAGRKTVYYIHTDHKPLCFAFNQKSIRCTSRQLCHMDFIGQYSADIGHIKGFENDVADALSQIQAISVPSPINFEHIIHAQLNEEELKEILTTRKTSLNWRKMPVENSDLFLHYDDSTGVLKLYIPKEFRKQVFNQMHNLAHPGIRITGKLIRKCYVWPSIAKDCSEWARQCLSCQRTKISRHTVTPLQSFELSSERFQDIHIDIIGRLPPSRGYSYCLTCIDRFSRWSEAFPLVDITSESIAQAFYEGWIVRFGVPQKISTDQGGQFEAHLFRSLSVILGADKVRSSPFHPKGQGIIERFHRNLKASIECHVDKGWAYALPTVMMGWRAVIKEDLQATPAEMVYGTTIRLPGEFISEQRIHLKDPVLFVEKLRNTMRMIRPVPASAHCVVKTFVHKSLDSCSHVFIRRDSVRKALVPPYDGPYKVITRKPKYFRILVKGKHTCISKDRLKPAFLPSGFDSDKLPSFPVPRTTTPPEYITRSGRRVRFRLDPNNTV